MAFKKSTWRTNETTFGQTVLGKNSSGPGSNLYQFEVGSNSSCSGGGLQLGFDSESKEFEPVWNVPGNQPGGGFCTGLPSNPTFNGDWARVVEIELQKEKSKTS